MTHSAGLQADFVSLPFHVPNTTNMGSLQQSRVSLMLMILRNPSSCAIFSASRLMQISLSRHSKARSISALT